MIVKWLDRAVKDLQVLRDYIAQDKNVAAGRVAKKILYAVNMLSKQPEIGRHGRVAHTRELIIPGTLYIVPYRVKDNKVEILRVFHCAMQWPEEF